MLRLQISIGSELEGGPAHWKPRRRHFISTVVGALFPIEFDDIGGRRKHLITESLVDSRIAVFLSLHSSAREQRNVRNAVSR